MSPSYHSERPLRGWELVLRGYPRRELTGAHFQQPHLAESCGLCRGRPLWAARMCRVHRRGSHGRVSGKPGPGGKLTCQQQRRSSEARGQPELQKQVQRGAKSKGGGKGEAAKEKQTPKNWVRKSGSRNRRRQGARRYNPTAELRGQRPERPRAPVWATGRWPRREVRPRQGRQIL